MGGAAIRIGTDDKKILDILDGVSERFKNMTPVMKVVGSIARTSIVRNFEKGGRPKWKKHGPMTEARRGEGSAILQQEGHLKESINVRAARDHVLIGTNKVYGAVHQFGAEKGEFGTITVHIKKHVREIAGSVRLPLSVAYSVV